jgi:DmsE family decaheme c-type cytochrome
MKRARFALIAAAFLLVGCWKIAAAQASGSQAKAVADKTSQQAQSSSTNYVGDDTCMTCHSDVAKDAIIPHAKTAFTHSAGQTCESCHGPGKAHVDSGGDPTKIFRFTTASEKQVNATCLRCHAAVHPNFAHSDHAKAGLSCIDCHSTHRFKDEENHLKASQPGLCETCHADVKMAFAQPFHHKVPEGLVKCTDCHDPHGSFQSPQLRTTADQNAICTQCHTETAGPFVYEHPVVKTEGCVSCHSPHGSPNPRLLRVGNVNTLCLQCHSASMNFTTPGTPSFHNQAAQYQACIVCHTQIHGSNASDVFFK